MTNWMDSLERLAKLRSEGLLTDTEFAEQKVRILAQSDSALTSDVPVIAETSFEESEASGISPWLWVVLGGSSLMAILLYMLWPIIPEKQENEEKCRITANVPKVDATESAEVSEPQQPVALDNTLAFAKPSLCIAGGTLEKLYLKLDKAMASGGGGNNVTLDEFEAPLPVEASKKKDSGGMEKQSAYIRFPEATTWHSLTLSRIVAEWYLPPETDSSYSRSITFLESPQKVQKVLARLGFNAPLDPDYSELPDTYNGCGGAMYIEAIPGGSSLSCGWGC